MLYRAAWLTDIHLNFVAKERVADLADGVRRLGIDSVLVGGDIGESPNFVAYLDELAVRIARPVYFVLGNHDFYRGSIAAVREEARRLSRARRGITWLPDTEFVELTADTALVGHDAWGDGRAADFLEGRMPMLNDCWLIEELAAGRGDGSVASREHRIRRRGIQAAIAAEAQRTRGRSSRTFRQGPAESSRSLPPHCCADARSTDPGGVLV